MPEHIFVRPVDVLYLRGNRLFGHAGAHSESLMPPWPSVAAGALRSRMLADAGIDDLSRYAEGTLDIGPLGSVLGSPKVPGSFRVTRFTLARRGPNTSIETVFKLPSDLVVESASGATSSPWPGSVNAVHQLVPTKLPMNGGRSASGLPLTPVLRATQAFKPRKDVWLCASGMAKHLRGDSVERDDLIPQASLWHRELRLGIGLHPQRRTAEIGQLYTAETVSMKNSKNTEVGFMIGVSGVQGFLPRSGLLRFGGDGRGASVETCAPTWPSPDLDTIASQRRCRIILATPGMFTGGWCLPGVDAAGVWHGPDGMRGRLAAAAVPRHDVVSGWDLAQWAPKPALRVAPSGSVYWLTDLECDSSSLRKLADEGFWSLTSYPDLQRRAEGFNHLLLAVWPQT